MDEFEKLNLKPIKGVRISELLLDPNNPRFSRHHDELIPENKIADPEIQKKTFERMIQGNDEFEINDLANSIKTRGFAPVDNIFVKRLKGTEKYQVVEGNRRITAIKLLLNKHNEGATKNILPEEILDTLKKIDCFDLTNNSQDEIDFVLGLRHHGSIKQWGLLPSSFNIYKKYMEELDKEEDSSPDDFVYDAKIAKKIAALYSLHLSEVRSKLQTYRAYLQLRELTHDQNLADKFSIINDSIKSKVLRDYYGFDDQTCTFSDEGVETFISLNLGKDGIPPVITAAASGEANLRDLAYVIENGKEEDITRILVGREKPSDIKAEVNTKRSERNLIQSLEIIATELKKIKLGNDFEGLGDREREILGEIQNVINKINKLSEK